jgi:hypothetical protein
MNPINRSLTLVGSALVLIIGTGVGTFQLFGIWTALAAVFVTSWFLSHIVKQGLALGAHFMHRQLTNDPDFEDARFGTAEEAGISALLQEAADSVRDTDLQEALHHFTHIAGFCPGSKAHAGSLLLVLVHLEMRLKASSMQPLQNEDRMPIH